MVVAVRVVCLPIGAACPLFADFIAASVEPGFLVGLRKGVARPIFVAAVGRFPIEIRGVRCQAVTAHEAEYVGIPTMHDFFRANRTVLVGPRSRVVLAGCGAVLAENRLRLASRTEIVALAAGNGVGTHRIVIAGRDEETQAVCAAYSDPLPVASRADARAVHRR